MEPWMIEKLREEERRKKPSRIPLYLPLVENPLTGSSDEVKERERNSDSGLHTVAKLCPGGGIGRHRGLKIPFP